MNYREKKGLRVPTYLIDQASMLVEGPFLSSKEAADKLSAKDESDIETFLVIDIGETGEASVELGDEWLEDHVDDTDEED